MANIRGVTVELGGDTSGLKKALKDVNKEINSTSKELKAVERLLKLDPKNTELLRQKQQLLANQINTTKEKLDALKQAEADMKANGVDQNSEQFRALEREIVATEQQLNALQSEYNSFGSVAAQQIAAVGEKMKDLGEKTAEVGEKMTKSLTVPIMAGFGAAVKTTADFDEAMSQVAATMGITTDQMETEIGHVNLAWGEFNGTLREFAIEMGEHTAFSATEAAEALNYMALAGYSTAEAMQMLPTVLNLAAAGNIDLAQASDMVTDVQTAFQISFERTTQMVDEMAKAASTGNTSVQQLGEAFLRVGGLATELNGGFIRLRDGTIASVDGVNELEIALTAMANAGIKGSEAGTHMRNMLMKLSSPTSEGTKQLEALGVAVFDTEGRMRSLKDIFGDLNSELSNLTQKQKIQAISDLFNARDLASAEAMLNAIGSDWDKIGEAILNAQGAAQQMADTKLDNLKGQLTLLKSALTTLAITIGDILMPYIRQFTSWIQGLVDKLNSLDDRTKRIIVVVALVVAAIGPLLIVLGKVMSGIGSILTTLPRIVGAIKMIIGGVSSLFSFLAANPTLLIIAAIAAAVIGLTILIVTHLDEIKAAVAAAGEWIKNVASTVANWVRNTARAAYNGVVSIIRGIGTVCASIASGIANMVGSIIDAVVAQINAVVAWLQSVARAIAGLFGGTSVNARGFSGRVGKMASGGVISSGSAVVGENGPELLTMAGNKAQITPLTATLERDALASIAGASGVQKVEISFTGSLAQLARVLQPVIQVETERRGPAMIKT